MAPWCALHNNLGSPLWNPVPGLVVFHPMVLGFRPTPQLLPNYVTPAVGQDILLAPAHVVDLVFDLLHLSDCHGRNVITLI